MKFLNCSLDGASSNLNWTSAKVHKQTTEFLDVAFTAIEGDFRR